MKRENRKYPAILCQNILISKCLTEVSPTSLQTVIFKYHIYVSLKTFVYILRTIQNFTIPVCNHSHHAGKHHAASCTCSE